MNTQLGIRKTLLNQLKNKKSPAQVLDLAVSAGVSKDDALRELEAIFRSESEYTFLPVLGSFLQQQKKISPLNTPVSFSEVWDPAGEKITKKTFIGATKKLLTKYQVYKENPGLIRRNAILLGLIPIGFFVLMPLVPALRELLFSGNDFNWIGFLFLPVIIYLARIHQLQRDLVKMVVADEYGWVYSSEKQKDRWSKLAGIYPHLFDKGSDQNIQDEFWGKFRGKKQTVDFWSGIFEYTTGSGKQKTVHKKTAFALHLNTVLKSNFRLEPEGDSSSFFRFFRRKKEIDTESNAFNKTFAVFYNGKKQEKQLEIIKILSPSVQVRLLEIANREGKFIIQFQKDTVVFIFQGLLLQNMKSNFFKKVSLDARDKKAINERINRILDITSDILPFLD